jgi:hypothetical protein
MRVHSLVGAVLGSLLMVGEAEACSCRRSPDGGTVSPPAAQVFVGRVISLERVSIDHAAAERAMLYNRPRGEAELSMASYMRVCFAVEKLEKGMPQSSVCLKTGYGGGDCGFAFTVGNRYRVYAHEDHSSWELRLETGTCDETQAVPS